MSMCKVEYEAVIKIKIKEEGELDDIKENAQKELDDYLANVIIDNCGGYVEVKVESKLDIIE